MKRYGPKGYFSGWLHLARSLACAAVAFGTAKAQVHFRPLNFDLQFIRIHASDFPPIARPLDTAPAPEFNADRQRQSVDEINTVWAQCGIQFNLVAAESLAVPSVDHLKPTRADIAEERQILLQRIGQTQIPDAGTLNAFNILAAINALPRTVASLFSAEPLSTLAHHRLIRVVELPHLTPLFPVAVNGATFSAVPQALVHDIYFNQLAEPSPRWHTIDETYFLAYGSTTDFDDRISEPALRRAFPIGFPGPGRYPNTLAHELGHYFGLPHGAPGSNTLMAEHWRSNRLTPQQCLAARAFAVRTKTD